MTTQQILQGVHDWTNGKIVYDISVAHPDGQGNPTKYADLTAALGTVGANIPENLRKGGMSIKFIQSSDNKYVQARCMAQNFTTDVTQWQGVDEVPTEGSKNLVESGGVYGITHPAMSQFKYIDLSKYPRAKGNINSSDQKWTNVTKNNRIHFIIPVADLGGIGAEFYMEIDTNVTSSWAFLSDYNVVQDGDASVISMGYIGTHDGNKWIVPENAVYLYLVDFQDTHNVIDRLWLPNILTEIQEGIKELQDGVNNDSVPVHRSNKPVKSGGLFTPINALERVFIPIRGNVGIIGDSISSFRGIVPDGYDYAYPKAEWNVLYQYQTWWDLILSETKCELDVNASWSGSCATNIRTGKPSFYDRVNVLNAPDYIFVALGTNDSTYGAQLGEYDFDSAIVDLSETTFRTAYIKGIRGLQTNYPNAKIVCLAFQMKDEFVNSIKFIAEHYNIPFIDCRDYYIDNVHPDDIGMEKIAQSINRYFTSYKFDTEPTKGHTNKAVSSDQIADIKKPIDIHFEIINTDAYTKVNGNVSSLNKPANSIWTNVNTDARHIAIPVSVFGGVGSTLSVKARSSYSTIGFLSQYSIDDVIQNNPSHLISGTSFGNNYNEIKHFVIPDNASHVYVLMNISDGTDVSPDVYKKDDVTENTINIASISNITNVNKNNITLLRGHNITIDPGTTYNYNNKTVSNRVGVVYPIEYPDNSFKINLSNITLNEGSNIRISLLNNKGFTSAYIVKTIKSTTSPLEDYLVIVEDSYKADAKYLGIYIYNSTEETGTQCFDAEVEIVGDVIASNLVPEINRLDTRITQVEQTISTIEGGNGDGGDDCLYERKAIQSTIPYYLERNTNPSSYEDGYYLEQKIKDVPKDGRSFIFITDTHIERPDWTEDYPSSRNARRSDLLLSYVKKRCGLYTGIFGGDCIDADSTKYIAAEVLTDYASEFFGVFGKNGLWAHGNHDCNSNAVSASGIDESVALINDEETYKRTVKTIENEVVFDTAGLTALETVLTAADFDYAKWWWKMHYFKDVPELKTRFIVFESGDNGYGAKLFKSYSGVKWMQFDFVANALNTIPEGYDAVITCHQCGQFTTVGAMDKVPDLATYDLAFMKLLSTYKTKGTYTVDISDFSGTNATVVAYWTAMGGTASTSRTFDMSEHQGSGRVLFITGHFHNDITLVCQTVNNNFSVARVCEHAKTDVEAFDDTKSYKTGDEVVYNDTIYAAGTNMSAGSFDFSKWLPLLDKDNLEDDAVFLLWRNRDAYSARYSVNGSKEYAAAYMTLGTITEQSFDIISLLEDKIKITKIGAGEDVELPI